MKKLWKLALAFTACAAALCLTAAAAEADTAPIKVWGTVSPWDGEGIFLKNGDEADNFSEVVVHLGDAPVVDAETGLPLDVEDIQEDDTLYAWINPAVTLSLPPQGSAIVAVGNVPADGVVPEYYEIAMKPVMPMDSSEMEVQTVGGKTFTVPADVEIGPWLTRQIVTLEDLIPGTQVLVWKDAEGKAEKIIVFAYAYEGYLNLLAASHGELLACINGEFDDETPQFSCKKAENGTALVPVRAVAEAIGCEVRWDKELGAVVSRNGDVVLSAKPGAEVIQTSEGECGISVPCVLENGVTYLPAADLAYWLNVFFVG